MKYILFLSAVAGVLPAIYVLALFRHWIRWAVFALFLPLLLFDSTAINFLSHEAYRGTSRGLEISLAYLIALTILGVITLLRGLRNPLPEAGSRLYLLYFLLCLPSLANADTPLYSLFELWKMAMLLLVFLAVYYYLEYSKGDFDILLYGIGVIVAGNCFTLLKQYLGGAYQPHGLFPHQNSLAMFMTLTGTLYFARILNRRDRFTGPFFLMEFLMASLTLVRTFSRGALASYPIAALWTLFFSLKTGITPRKLNLITFIFSIATLGLLLTLPRIIDRFENAPVQSGTTRKEFAMAALHMMSDNPLAGVGLNNWGIQINPPSPYSKHRHTNQGEDYKDGIVETIYLLVGAECGIPCLLALLIWFGYYWFSCLKLMKRLRWTKYYYLPVGILGGLTGIYLQSALEWVLKQQINFLTLMVAFAMVSYLNTHWKMLREREEEANAPATATDSPPPTPSCPS